MGKKKQTKSVIDTGKLKIGNNWNAITIIALSQNNPLKAIAEFVENSIDAKAKNITIIRGKLKGETYLKIIDDAYESFIVSLDPLKDFLISIIGEQKRTADVYGREP